MSLDESLKNEIIARLMPLQPEKIILFGSYAYGEPHKDSDIDLLVNFLPGSTLLDQVGLIDALSTALGRKVDIVSESALNKHLRQQILQEAVAL